MTYARFMKIKDNCDKMKEGKNNIIAKNFIKLYDFLKEVEERIKHEFINKFKFDMFLELNKENIENKNDNEIFFIGCIYKVKNPNDNNKKYFCYKDENILIDKTNSKFQGFAFLVDDLNSEKYNNKNINNNFIDNQKMNDNKKKIKDKEKYTILDETINNSYLFENQNFGKADPEKIIEFMKIIGDHKDSADFILELNNGFYIR